MTCGPTGSTSFSTPRRSRRARRSSSSPTTSRRRCEKDAKNGRITLTARDLLSEGEEVTLTADLVVLVTGMVPRENEGLISALKLPVGQSGFFNEIHPKLRPVETVVDGAYICGACQAPQDLLRGGGLRPGGGDPERGDPQARLRRAGPAGRHRRRRHLHLVRRLRDTPARTTPSPRSQRAARRSPIISRTSCKGCGGCVPVCPSDAIDLQGYTDAQIKAMIDGMLEVVCQ